MKMLVQHTAPLHRCECRNPWDASHPVIRSSDPKAKESRSARARGVRRPRGVFRLLPESSRFFRSQDIKSPPTLDESHGNTVLLRNAVDESSDFGFLALVLQGSGPHFCPGGNVNASIRDGETAFTIAPFTGFVAELRLRQSMAGAGSADVWVVVCCLHGLVQGGGLAMSQVVDFRVCDAEASIVLGNLSRGAVPCILLSGTLPLIFQSLAEAIGFYLEDAILDSNSALALNLVQEVQPNILATREAAFQRAMEMNPVAAWQMSALRPLVDVNRFAQEACALQLSLKCGEAFQTVTTQVEVHEPQASEKISAGSARRKRPLKRSLKALPPTRVAPPASPPVVSVAVPSIPSAMRQRIRSVCDISPWKKLKPKPSRCDPVTTLEMSVKQLVGTQIAPLTG